MELSDLTRIMSQRVQNSMVSESELSLYLNHTVIALYSSGTVSCDSAGASRHPPCKVTVTLKFRSKSVQIYS